MDRNETHVVQSGHLFRPWATHTQTLSSLAGMKTGAWKLGTSSENKT